MTHPNILKIQNLTHDNKNYYIISELMEGGELFGRLANKDANITEKVAANILKQVLLAVNYMHTPLEGKPTIAHRDLKPENILLESKDLKNFNIKIADFGFGSFIGSD